MLQAPYAVNERGRPDDAVASTSKSRLPTRLPAIGPNVIVWFFSDGHVAGALPIAVHTAPLVFGVPAHADAGRLVASSSAAPASSTPQPTPGVQSGPVRCADCFRMSATWKFVRSERAAQISAATPATSGAENDVPGRYP